MEKKKRRKVGRPRLPKHKAKGKIVPIRFSKNEAELIGKAAKASGQSVSEWIRTKAIAATGA